MEAGQKPRTQPAMIKVNLEKERNFMGASTPLSLSTESWFLRRPMWREQAPFREPPVLCEQAVCSLRPHPTKGNSPLETIPCQGNGVRRPSKWTSPNWQLLRYFCEWICADLPVARRPRPGRERARSGLAKSAIGRGAERDNALNPRNIPALFYLVRIARRARCRSLHIPCAAHGPISGDAAEATSPKVRHNAVADSRGLTRRNGEKRRDSSQQLPQGHTVSLAEIMYLTDINARYNKCQGVSAPVIRFPPCDTLWLPSCFCLRP